MIIFGGMCVPVVYTDYICESIPPYTGFPRYYGDTVAYDPATGAWASLRASGSGAIGTGASAVWTGSRMIVWGGFFRFRLGPGPDGIGWDTSGAGSIYDPASNLWTSIPFDAAVQDRSGHRAVWDGHHMYILGGGSAKHKYDPSIGYIINTSQGRPSMARFDPETRVWENLGIPPFQGDHALWTGRLILTWGGTPVGGRFDPATGLWSSISTIGAPPPRPNAAVAWDGEGMLVHGGSTFSTGGRYFPDQLTGPDGDADGFTQCTGDCDDADPAVNPGAAEACNGLDDDCDGVQDNGDPGGGVACGSTDVGECSLGVTRCTAGALACVGEVGAQPEACNGLDDDCDGVLDDGNPGGGVACGSDIGACSQGVSRCDGGVYACVGDVGPRAEACNGLDDDCDGDVPFLEADADGDGYRGCAGDCLDSDSRVRPGATDLPGNLLDENCDGVAACSPAASWKSHGAFVTCVVRECSRLVAGGLATRHQCMAAISASRSRLKQKTEVKDRQREPQEQVREPGGN
ncbi:MAG: MopE-related protein [Candidatus Polarisedimenticolia bacterium]